MRMLSKFARLCFSVLRHSLQGPLRLVGEVQAVGRIIRRTGVVANFEADLLHSAQFQPLDVEREVVQFAEARRLPQQEDSHSWSALGCRFCMLLHVFARSYQAKTRTSPGVVRNVLILALGAVVAQLDLSHVFAVSLFTPLSHCLRSRAEAYAARWLLCGFCDASRTRADTRHILAYVVSGGATAQQVAAAEASVEIGSWTWNRDSVCEFAAKLSASERRDGRATHNLWHGFRTNSRFI